MVVRGSFHLFRVLVFSDLYLMFRISNALFVISVNCISALYFFSSSFWVCSPQIGWEPIQKVQMLEKIVMYTYTCFDNSTQPWVAFCWNEVAIQSKVFNLGGIRHILPGLWYCNRYAWCNASLFSSSHSDLSDIRFCRTWSFFSCVVEIPCLAFHIAFSWHSLSWTLILTAADLLLSCRLSSPQVSYI